MNIPSQYLPIMPYLIIKDANGFINFMKAVFGAEEQLKVPRSENVIAHGELKIHDAVIMFADATEQFGVRNAGMFIYIPDVDTVYNKAIEHRAKSLHPPVQQEYGYSAGFEDPFGNQWWIVQP